MRSGAQEGPAACSDGLHSTTVTNGPGYQRARRLADGYKADVTHPTIVAAKVVNARLTAAGTLRRWHAGRHERPDPPSPWTCVMEGCGDNAVSPEP